jgi:hypothetical protein
MVYRRWRRDDDAHQHLYKTPGGRKRALGEQQQRFGPAPQRAALCAMAQKQFSFKGHYVARAHQRFFCVCMS